MDNKKFKKLLKEYKESVKLNEKKVSWDNNIITLYHPEFKLGKDRIYFSKEVPGKSDYYYTKLIPNEMHTYEEDGKNYTVLKKSGKRIHSDDFSKILQLAESKKFNIYTFDEHNTYISNKYVILEGKSSEIFNGSKGKWIR